VILLSSKQKVGFYKYRTLPSPAKTMADIGENTADQKPIYVRSPLEKIKLALAVVVFSFLMGSVIVSSMDNDGRKETASSPWSLLVLRN
jgi:hypothetical protein